MDLEQETSIDSQAPKRARPLHIFLYVLAGLFFAITLLVSLVVTYLNAPTDYDLPTTFTVESGTSVRAVAASLREQGIVRSETFLYLVLVTLHDPTSIKASTYVLDEHFSTTQIARQLVAGDFGNDLVRLTHIEGERAEALAAEAEKVLIDFDTNTFLAAAIPREGRLYPDTYFVPETFTANELLDLLEAAFEDALLPYQEKIEASPLSLDQILILASIIEREANSPESINHWYATTSRCLH